MIHLVTALPSEANPLVSHFGLEGPVVSEPYRIYRGPGLCLVVSGPGSSACSGAVRTMRKFHREIEQPAWVNVGIAGHKNWPVGRAAIAQEVVEDGSGRVWPLQVPEIFGPQCARVRTVSKVEHDYPRNALYDMEAAGFCAALDGQDVVQVLKVVSDNRSEGPGLVTARKVQELIEAAVPLLDDLLSHFERTVQ